MTLAKSIKTNLTLKLIGGWIQWRDMQILFKFLPNRMKNEHFRTITKLVTFGQWGDLWPPQSKNIDSLTFVLWNPLVKLDEDSWKRLRVRQVFCFNFYTQEQSGELPIAQRIYQGGEEGFLKNIQVGVEEVKEQLGNLREDKALGPDNMHLRELRDVAELLSR